MELLSNYNLIRRNKSCLRILNKIANIKVGIRSLNKWIFYFHLKHGQIKSVDQNTSILYRKFNKARKIMIGHLDKYLFWKICIWNMVQNGINLLNIFQISKYLF